MVKAFTVICLFETFKTAKKFRYGRMAPTIPFWVPDGA